MPARIMATGRSDYPGQQRVLASCLSSCGAPDVRAPHQQRRNEDRREFLSPRHPLPGSRKEVCTLYGWHCAVARHIIPKPMNPRLIIVVQMLRRRIERSNPYPHTVASG
jgi:hypothetical protein